MTKNNFRSGIISIAGNPNVGKSTLLNRLLGQKIAIVSPRPQTTRGVIRGIYTDDKMQILFVDNPGFLSPRDKLDEFMFKQAHASVNSADLVYLVVEPRMPDQAFQEKVLVPVIEAQKPVFLLINKVDTIAKIELLPIIDAFNKLYTFKQIIPLSALQGDNVADLLKATVDYLPEGPPLFPDDMVSDQYERFFVSELIREKIFLLTHQEIPYSVAVRIDEFAQREEGKWFIRATIVLDKESHKGIVIGKGGFLIKKIGSAARLDIEDMLGVECYLELFVKVIKDWKKKDIYLRELGYKE
ncbi:MAG: GTPase Era [Candidatus Auribacterota bacterium]